MLTEFLWLQDIDKAVTEVAAVDDSEKKKKKKKNSGEHESEKVCGVRGSLANFCA